MTSDDQNQALVMLLKANEFQANIDEVRLWEKWYQTNISHK